MTETAQAAHGDGEIFTGDDGKPYMFRDGYLVNLPSGPGASYATVTPTPHGYTLPASVAAYLTLCHAGRGTSGQRLGIDGMRWLAVLNAALERGWTPAGAYALHPRPVEPLPNGFIDHTGEFVKGERLEGIAPYALRFRHIDPSDAASLARAVSGVPGLHDIALFLTHAAADGVDVL